MNSSKATADLVIEDDGSVAVQVVTQRPLEPFTTNRRGVLTPEEFFADTQPLARAGLTVAWNDEWTMIELTAYCPGNLVSQVEVTMQLDLRQGKPHREAVKRILASGEDRIPVVWVNQGARTHSSKISFDHWQEALDSNADLTDAQWNEDIAELRWQRSEAYRPWLTRPRPYKTPYVATEPAGGLEHFATRTSKLPGNGRPKLDGITLPAGKRMPKRWACYWASTDPVTNLELLAPQLAASFPQTGLWPLLWNFPDEPDSYMAGAARIDQIDDLDPLTLLNNTAAERNQPTIPALAPAAAPKSPTTPANDDLFAAFASAPSPYLDTALESPARLLLVPCNRPADAICMLGGNAGERDGTQTAAILRSWETRYGATLYKVAPSRLYLTVARPPSTPSQADALATEIHLAGPTDKTYLADQTPDDTATQLLYSTEPTNPDEPTISRYHWVIPV